jgi:hypothetical protein
VTDSSGAAASVQKFFFAEMNTVPKIPDQENAHYHQNHRFFPGLFILVYGIWVILNPPFGD